MSKFVLDNKEILVLKTKISTLETQINKNEHSVEVIVGCTYCYDNCHDLCEGCDGSCEGSNNN